MGQAKAPTHPARPARRIIERPRLLKLLEETDAQTILLVAPAGYGKTTLARQWFESVGGAWITLTPAACDLAVLGRTLAQALCPDDKAVHRLVEQVLAAGTRASGQVQSLVDAISTRHSFDSEWLIVDDYHAVASNESAGSLLHGLHQRGTIRMVIASRVRPDWAGSRELIYGETIELKAAELALEIGETSQLLEDQKSALFLQGLSRGWPAVIGLAAHLGSTGLDLNARSLADSIYDFVAEELYQHTPLATREHLARLAVHPPVSYDQAAVLLGDSAAVESVLGTGLANDLAGRVEIHPLARSFLYTKVRAHTDYEQLVELGIKFAIDNSAWDEAFELIDQFDLCTQIEGLIVAAYESLVETGRFVTLEKYARWGAAHGGVSSELLDLVEAEIAVRDADTERAASLGIASAEAFPDGHRLKARGFLIAGSALHLVHRLEESRALFTKALKHASSTSEAAAAAWRRYLGALYLEDGRSEELFAEFKSVAGTTPAERVRVIIGRQHLGRLTNGLYDVTAEAAVAAELLESIVDPWVRTAWGNTYGYTLFLQARYPDAHRVLTATLDEITEFDLEFGRPHIEWTLAAVELGLRRFLRAERMLRKVERAAKETANEHLRLNTDALRARLLLAEHRASEAEPLVATDFTQFPSRGMYGEYLATRALVQATLGRREIVAEICGGARSLTKAVETRVLCAAAEAVAALDTSSSDEFARRLLDEALRLKTWDGVVCAVRAAPPLLAQLARFGDARYELADALRRSNDVALAKQARLIPRTPHVRQTPLSPREREVLELVSVGLHNTEIAAALFISSATVKVHMRHILEKLGARTRADAVSRYAEISSEEAP